MCYNKDTKLREVIKMKATGIVRRMDDLGRVVIPKEIRRSMRIKEGDPLELFTTHEGELVLKKYQPYGEKDWKMAEQLTSTIIKNGFIIYDNYGERVGGTIKGIEDFDLDDIENMPNMYKIGTYWDTYGYLHTTDSNYGIALDILRVFLERE